MALFELRTSGVCADSILASAPIAGEAGEILSRAIRYPEHCPRTAGIAVFTRKKFGITLEHLHSTSMIREAGTA